ncbi:type II toxin-antitoxin system RelE/ParE family toxin [Rhizobium sp. PL01]|uniref:type II toxin-antitoxin system RelE/ParE family toxin n=1 Tax=Rhizobium sp. PL01 TaxID=3085631 RepID=UPI002980FDC6|nr:type II toxin-antitoxin system RelE/ParE family toxin [Rhizobium sp. PL01]MDW5314284.1 type II toxin-antitoxin system RelE/ParE family toxin [Rhizobium sp. PL01]
MLVFETTDVFKDWLFSLRDMKAKARILARIRSAEFGNLGDCSPVGEGVSEMRIHYGPGYRLYFKRTGDVVYLLLAGGDKSSQKRDIAAALKMAKSLQKDQS